MPSLLTGQLVLASASPRRKALLGSLGLDLIVDPADIDEELPLGADPVDVALELAFQKASRVAIRQTRPRWVLGADTLVVIENEVLGKPQSEPEATSMLQRLSGCAHEVITGMCLLQAQTGQAFRRAVSTQVEFAPLSAELIEAYIRTGEPMDKAGAYGIQGLGGMLVRRISGSYTNVVGLPLAELTDWLLSLGIARPVSLACQEVLHAHHPD